MTSDSDLLQKAEAQEAAARHCTKIGLHYLAYQHKRVARALRAEAKKEAASATGGTESS